MVIDFKKIVVSKKEERKFIRRARKRLPNEYIEAIWGFVRGETLYICVFFPLNHEGKPRSLRFMDWDGREVEDNVDVIDDLDDEAKEENLSYLGTIHTHPNCEESNISENDIFSARETGDLVSGICAFRNGKYVRAKITYWPTLNPIKVDYRN